MTQLMLLPRGSCMFFFMIEHLFPVGWVSVLRIACSQFLPAD